MLQAKKYQTILDEVLEISRIPMVLYDASGAQVASTVSTAAGEWQDTVGQFLASEVETQSIGNFHYFKVIDSDAVCFVLLVLKYSPDSFTIGRLTVCQLRNLMDVGRDAVTKANFLRSLVTGGLTDAEAERQAHKLKVSPVTWVVFIIECEDGYGDSYAYKMLEHAFAGGRMDLYCKLDDNRLLLAKDADVIRKDYRSSHASSTSSRRKKNAVPAQELLEQSLRLFAQTMVDTLRAENLIQTHVGYSSPTDNIQGLANAYQEAVTALHIRRTFFAEQDTVSYDRLGIGQLITELPVKLCEKFLREVFGEHIPEDFTEEEQNTIQKFYENNLNISETSRQLYLHRNTLVYRLERLEKMLGLDIRKFEDAMTFKLAMMVLAHVRGPHPIDNRLGMEGHFADTDFRTS